MTKKETTALLEAVKNAPIVNNSITVTVCGTTFTFGNEWRNHITEDTRQQLIDSIGARCRKKLTRSISKKELDEPGLKSQNRIVKKRLEERAESLKKSKGTMAPMEDFYFVLDGMEYVQQPTFDTALVFAKSIGKRRSDVWMIRV